ncbi:hypothetical protein DY000_02057909 [Brassica cretica]|uniref:Pentacotripeptide-repeat region of PRORP domain-containing protein n=1 Tax=Brassica cretica TaxID=69181 RepID=A0ABQ7AI44_BRACR|nr:hypothetical protein DY000_02057909 [Brassica cretica]
MPNMFACLVYIQQILVLEVDDSHNDCALRKGRMIGRLIQPQRIALFSAFSVLSNGTVSYKERLRSGLVGIKKDDAVDLFESMVRCRHPLPSLVDFSRLFSGIARTKQYDLVLHLCKKMELQGITHNNYTLTIVINCYCRRRKLGFAFSAIGKMLKLGYEPNTVTFNTLLNGLCLEGRVSEAVELVDHRMMDNGCQPDEATYGPVTNRMCKSWNTASALDLLRKMEDRKVKPQVVTYSMIIDGLCKDGSLDDALRLFNEMETKGIKPNVFTYNSLIRGFCNAGRWDDGAQLLRDMITREITPYIVTFNALIDSLVKEGKLTEAKELYNEMITRGIDPDTITYNSLIYGLCMLR